MVDKPFNLSQKIWNNGMIYRGDVKTYVRMVREAVEDISNDVPALLNRINELAGEYLI